MVDLVHKRSVKGKKAKGKESRSFMAESTGPCRGALSLLPLGLHSMTIRCIAAAHSNKNKNSMSFISISDSQQSSKMFMLGSILIHGGRDGIP